MKYISLQDAAVANEIVTLEQDEKSIVEEANSQEIPEIVDDAPEPVPQDQAMGK